MELATLSLDSQLVGMVRYFGAIKRAEAYRASSIEGLEKALLDKRYSKKGDLRYLSPSDRAAMRLALSSVTSAKFFVDHESEGYDAIRVAKAAVQHQLRMSE